MKQAHDKMYFYEKFSEEFDSKMNMYDTKKRVSVIFNDLLTGDLKGKSLLDAGCGTGWFSLEASKRGADVIAMDLGEGLLSKVKEKADVKTVVGSIMKIPFPSHTFDYVISSEVIEHTPDPKLAIREVCRVLKPGGTLVMTTPNRLWYFSIWIANKLSMRPYQGLENWISWKTLVNEIENSNCEIKKKTGIHLFPFIHPISYPVLNFFHRFNNILFPFMINMGVKAVKRN
jgi:2-polyprenyl-3-methyl-5-hydroxy-6-metoxy-1,4-benzoquinol methylase